jgi:cobalamin biosynthesis Mg chelatase CobN
MRTVVKTVLLALLFLATPALSIGPASAAPHPAAAADAVVQAGAGSSGGVWAPAGNTPTPSPGDTASTGPANPGTGESAQNESTRVNFAPWVIGAIALVTLIVVLIWRRRRNTTIV